MATPHIKREAYELTAPAPRETVVFVGRGRAGRPKELRLHTKASAPPEEERAAHAKRLGVKEVVHMAQDELHAWLDGVVAASDRSKPVFVVSATMAPALHVLRTTHIPVAVIGRAPLPHTHEDLGAWRMQAHAWTLLKVLCVGNSVPFFAVGDPSAGFRVIARAMRRLDECAGQQLFAYALPLALTVLPVHERRSLFGLLRGSILKWGWHRPFEGEHRCTASACDIARTFVEGAGGDAALIPVGLWSALQTANAGGGSDEDRAVTAVWVHAAALLADEAWGVMKDAEKTFALPPAFTDAKEVVPGATRPSWGVVAAYAIEREMGAARTDGVVRDYEFNTVASALGGQLLVALGMLEALHSATFDPLSNNVECCWSVGADMAHALARHMQHEWVLSCLPGAAVIAAAKEKGVPPPPGLQDAKLQVSDGLIRALASGMPMAEAILACDGDGKRRRVTVGEDGEEGEDLDDDDDDGDSSDSDSSYSVGSVGDGSSEGEWESGEEEEEEDDDADDEEEEEETPVVVVRPPSKKRPAPEPTKTRPIDAHFKVAQKVVKEEEEEAVHKLGAAIVAGAGAAVDKTKLAATFASVFGSDAEEEEEDSGI